MLPLKWSSVILFKGRLCLANPFFFNCNNDNCSFVLDDFQGLISYFVLLTFPLPLNPKVLCFVTSIVIVHFQLPIFPFWNIKSLCSSFSHVSIEALSFLLWLSWKVFFHRFSTLKSLWNTVALFTDNPFGSRVWNRPFFTSTHVVILKCLPGKNVSGKLSWLEPERSCVNFAPWPCYQS